MQGPRPQPNSLAELSVAPWLPLRGPSSGLGRLKAVVCPGPHGARGRQERDNLCHLQLKESEQVGAGEERDGMEKKGKRGCSSRAVVEMVPKTKHLGKS